MAFDFGDRKDQRAEIAPQEQQSEAQSSLLDATMTPGHSRADMLESLQQEAGGLFDQTLENESPALQKPITVNDILDTASEVVVRGANPQETLALQELGEMRLPPQLYSLQDVVNHVDEVFRENPGALSRVADRLTATSGSEVSADQVRELIYEAAVRAWSYIDPHGPTERDLSSMDSLTR